MYNGTNENGGGKKEKYERKILHFHNKETIKQA